MNTINYLDLGPFTRAQGSVQLPGSKSISNRTLLLAALSAGSTTVHGLLRSDDTEVMLAALKKLGVKITAKSDGIFDVEGCSGKFPVKQADLFLGNAGTAFRPLVAVLAFNGGDYRLSGVPRMHERPIGDLVDALRQLGAVIRYEANEGYPPLVISPATVSAITDQIIEVCIRGNVSSQFLSALLMAAPLLNCIVDIKVEGELISRPYVEITLNMTARFGIHVENQNWQKFVIPADAKYHSPRDIYVEGDASSASYFLAAGAIAGGPVRVHGVGKSSIQGDVRFAEALAQMGAKIEMGEDWIEASAPESGKLKAIDADFNHIPDAAMTIAVAALFAEGTTTLRNIASWRVKETDRIAAMATELRKFGTTVEEGADYLRITPPATLTAPDTAIDTYDDHRMAMCFSLLALKSINIRINDPNCVAKTFPDYFSVFQSITDHPSPFTLRPSLPPVIAIDGPTASGKGTVAQKVAAALGFHYLDSGALYRITALAAQQGGIDLSDESKVVEVARNLDIRFEQEKVYLDGHEITNAIRTEEVGQNASRIAALPLVRLALLERQRAFLHAPGLVCDGRDMASVVFPDAGLKIFLTASVEARAERRTKQLKQKGISAIMRDVVNELRIRDERDISRSVAPLKQQADAHYLDTTTISADDAVQKILVLYREKSSTHHT